MQNQNCRFLTSSKMQNRLNLLVLFLAAMAVSSLAQTPIAATGKNKALGADESAAILSYWTPERLASAKPMDLQRADRSNPGAFQAPVTHGPQVFAPGARPTLSLPSGPAQQSASETDAAELSGLAPQFNYVYPFTTYADPDFAKYPEQTVGTLFFSLEGGNFRCSASVIRPHTLVTARHCVYDVNTGVFASNEVFYPGWTGGHANNKYGGAWVWRNAETWGGGGFNYDLALIQMADHNGTGCGGSSGTPPVEAYTGYLGYTYNGDFSQRQWAVLGFPAASNPEDSNPFNGKFLIRSDAATGHVNDDIGGVFTNTVEVGSDQTGGTSGGPWLIGYNPGTTATFKFGANSLFGSNNGNYANSVNSFKFTSPDHGLAINGPEFDDYNFLNLLTAYNTISCP